MKRKALALTMALLFSAVTGTLLTHFGKANPTVFSYTALPIISVHSPANNTYVNTNEVLVNFSITRPRSWEMRMSGPDWTISQELQSVRLIVDYKLYESITVGSNLSFAPFNYFVYLTNLIDGEHNITVQASASAFEYGQWYPKPKSFTVSNFSIVHFTVDTTPPTVTLLELENKEYLETEVRLNFTINEQVSKISYVLDGEENVTIAGNCTIANLFYGEHNLTVYATDEVGNSGASETVVFTIKEPPEPFPTNMVIAPVASVAFVGVGLLFYFKKRKRRRL